VGVRQELDPRKIQKYRDLCRKDLDGREVIEEENPF
jgi:hypothetical protein